MKVFWLAILFICSATLSKAQTNEINYKDSVLLISTWNQFVQAVDNSDKKTIKLLSKDTVECYCGNDTIDSDRPKWPVDKFSEQIISFIKSDPKLPKIIKTEKPSIYVHTVKWNNKNPEKIYSISYILFNPNEIAPGHEGGSIFFEFNKMKDTFIIRSISTIP